MPPERTAPYSFRPVTPEDLSLISVWLGRRHVAEWWDDGEGGLAEIQQALTDPATRPQIVALDDRPIGYIQSYDPHLEEGHPYQDQPQGTLGIDQFIGEPDLVGLGHGSRFIAAFVDGLFLQGAARVVTDPHPANGRAIRAYQKAGFRSLDTRHSVYGDVLLMARDAPGQPRDAIPRAFDAPTPPSQE
jgi:aminoglycoside 6'-N-acetyltransferase